MSDLAAVSLILGCLWVPLLYFGVRHRDLATMLAVVWIWGANALIGFGYVVEGRLASIPWILLLSALLIERLMQNPEHVKRVAARQVADARNMAHHEINDAMANFARMELQSRTEKQGLLERIDELEHPPGT